MRTLRLFALATFLAACAGPAATPSPTPTPGPVAVGTVTLTDDGCTWAGNPGSATTAAATHDLAFQNDTTDLATFQVHRLKTGFDWDDGVAAIASIQAAIDAGEDWPPEASEKSWELASRDVVAGASDRLSITPAVGTIGIVCANNDPVTLDVTRVILVGPLDVTG